MIPLRDDNPTELTPYVTVTLIVLAALVYLWQLSLGEAYEQAILALGVKPAALLGDGDLPPELAVVPAELTIFTSMFLHGSWMHLLGNMLFLWIFGNNVEDAMGHVRFIIFYLVCGVVAVFAQAVPNPESMIPMIGASGAVSGILGAYLLLYPHARVLVLIPIGFYPYITTLPAGWMLGFWFALQFLSSLLASGAEGGVAWGAHIGGFVAGMALIPLFRRRGVRLFQAGRRQGPRGWR